jgi:hypothetical protein
MIDAQTVKAVTAVVGDLSEDQVRRVLTAVETLRDGATPGTIVQDPKTGAVALRVTEGGVDYWSVSAPDGSQWRDMQPQLQGWKSITRPAAKTETKAAK